MATTAALHLVQALLPAAQVMLINSLLSSLPIVVSHRAWTLREMDRIHVFDDGRIVESGRFTELIGAGGRFAELFVDQTA